MKDNAATAFHNNGKNIFLVRKCLSRHQEYSMVCERQEKAYGNQVQKSSKQGTKQFKMTDSSTFAYFFTCIVNEF